jgi:cell wall-associated NlpC family hydrolase
MARHAAPKQPRPGPTRRTVAALAVTGSLGTGAVLVASGEAYSASGSSTVWDRLAQCESSGNFANRDTGHNGHFGGFQFSPSTWRSVGGSGNPADASPAEQLKRAKILLAQPGPLFNKWVCAPTAGLTRALGASQGLSVLNTLGHTMAAPAKAPQRASTAAQRAVAFARAQLGVPYVYGASGPHSFDCSGLTSAAWRAAGVTIPRTSQAQARMHRVALSAIQPGDLVIYKPGNGHVAIYIGGGKIIEAARTGTDVRTAPVHTGWYASNFRMVVRPVGVQSAGPAVHTDSAPAIHGRVHVVVRGETLSAIALHAHIKGGWPALYKINTGAVGKDPDMIKPGQRLVLPG